MQNKPASTKPRESLGIVQTGKEISVGIKNIKHLNSDLQELWSRYVDFVDNIIYIVNRGRAGKEINIDVAESFAIIYKIRRAIRHMLDDILSGNGRGLKRNEKSILGDVNTSLNFYNFQVDSYLNSLDSSGELEGAKIPTEVPAPVKITINNEKYHLKQEASYIGPLPEKTIESLRKASYTALEEISNELKRSDNNADRRLNISINTLLKEIMKSPAEFEIVALGVSWQIAYKSVEAASETLPEITSSQIVGALNAVENILLQFKEWKDYINFSNKDLIDDADIVGLVRDVGEAVSKIPIDDNFVDKRISEKLIDLTIAASNGLVRAEYAAAPLVGSMNNFIGTVAHVVVEQAPEIIATSPKMISAITEPSNVSRGIILFGISLKIIENIAPRIMKYKSFEWLRNVHEIAMKYYDKFKDATPR
ncbi:hypothetical protein LRS73_10930 [Methylobacterium currus]|uniref:hypothetical protein n=1 Tax=Methylobacterium currus TaxID=2051553 RepID=UPI001E3815AD|nr:hypothetical protein [Methylobacterium currus]UHC18309.1 hypothetical protein LRS73_10930 [Methylobacterium currus]